jgi:tryptophan-rich sensory protein
MKNWVKLLASIAIPQLVAATGAYVTITGRGSWYEFIQRPAWNPPDWVFGPVWTVIYILMGIAFYLVWKSDKPSRRLPMTLWGIQLGLNFLWSFLFFGQHEVGRALIEIFALWLAILLTIFSFAKINRTAAWLLVPYISWVSFAAILNYAIWILNR